jgi:hypothetical protein
VSSSTCNRGRPNWGAAEAMGGGISIRTSTTKSRKIKYCDVPDIENAQDVNMNAETAVMNVERKRSIMLGDRERIGRVKNE